jgi:hypothetical protein
LQLGFLFSGQKRTAAIPGCVAHEAHNPATATESRAGARTSICFGARETRTPVRRGAIRKHAPPHEYHLAFKRFGRVASRPALDEFDRTVIVAVIAVRIVQVAVDEIVDVVPMWHRFVTAPGSVDMARLVAAAVVARRTLVQIFPTDFERMLVYMITVRMM